MADRLASQLRRLPPRVRELLWELYSRDDWQEARFSVASPDIRSRWTSDYAASKHLKNLHMLGVLRLTPGLGGWMSTVPDERVREVVVEATAPRPQVDSGRQGSLRMADDRNPADPYGRRR